MMYRVWITDTEGRRVCYLSTGNMHKALAFKHDVELRCPNLEAYIRVEET